MNRSLAIALLALLPGSISLADVTPPVAPAPPVYEMALPARVTLIAWLPADKTPGAVDLDLRIDVVMPMKCGDKVAGLLRAGGATLDGPDSYELVVERRAVGACVKEPGRISARTAIRMKLAEGATGELTIGPQTFKVARKGELTLDGVAAEGDVAGAPPTARPTTFVTGEVSAAKLLTAAREAEEPNAARATVHLTARWPACAGNPVGMLARGDGTTHFTLTRFVPLAVAPLDERCTGKPVTKTSDVTTVVRVAATQDKADITVGAIAVVLTPGKAPAIDRAKK